VVHFRSVPDIRKVFKLFYEVTMWNPNAVSKQSALSQASGLCQPQNYHQE
jgi:hypothetical protein